MHVQIEEEAGNVALLPCFRAVAGEDSVQVVLSAQLQAIWR